MSHTPQMSLELLSRGTSPTLGASHHAPTQLSTHKYPRKVLSNEVTLLGMDPAIGGTAFTVDTTPGFGSMCKSKVSVSLKCICSRCLARLLQSNSQRPTHPSLQSWMQPWSIRAAVPLPLLQGVRTLFPVCLTGL